MQETLKHWFGEKTYWSATRFVHENRVTGYHYDTGERVLTGTVLGLGNVRSVYSVEVDFVYNNFSGPVVSIGDCGCYIGTLCPHICALLLQVLMSEGEDTLRNWIFGTKKNSVSQLQAQKSGLAIDNTVFADSREKATFERWMGNLQSAVRDIVTPEQQDQAKKKEQSSPVRGRRYLLYVLEETLDKSIALRLCSSQLLKNGSHGAVQNYNNLGQSDWYLRPPGSLEDRQLIQALYGAAYLDLFNRSYYSIHRFEPDMVDKDPEPLLALARSGRLAWRVQQRTPVIIGDPVEPTLEWHDHNGRLHCQLLGPDGSAAWLIPTQPMLLLSHQLITHADGNTVNTMLLSSIRSPLPESLLKMIVNAPSLPRNVLPQVQAALSPLPGLKQEHLPRLEEFRQVSPVPVLILDGIPAQENMPVNTAARARLCFQYDSLRTDQRSSQENLIDGKGVRYPRNSEQEQGWRQNIATTGMSPANQWVMEACYQGGDLCLGSLKSWQTAGKWLAFLHNIPTLENKGWVIEVDDSFPYSVVAVDDDDWYGEIEDGQPQEDWFGLKLGIDVDGEQLDLLPVIASQLDRLPSPEELAKMRNKLVPVAIEGQRFITMPAKRLRLIIVTLLELFSDRGAGLQKSQAPILEELSKGLGLDFSGGEVLQAIARKLKNFRKLRVVKTPVNFQAELRDYQKKGLAWLQFLREIGLGGILADDMGLGKTVQALAHLQLEKERFNTSKDNELEDNELEDNELEDNAPESKIPGRKGKKQGTANPVVRPSLVIAPTSLMHNWRREAERFAPELTVVVYHGSNRQEKCSLIPQADLVLTTYALIQRDFELLSEQPWHLLILDESQAIKNPNTKASRSVRQLKAEQRLCMTGTPVENNLAELWSQFDFLMPGFLGAKDRFSRVYRTPIERHGDNDRRKQLVRRLSPFMLRRTKELVAKELPPKTEILRACELTGKQRDLYETVRAAMEKKVRDEIHKKGLARSQIIILDALLKMRQTCCDPQLVKVSQARKVKESAKMKLLCELLDDLLAKDRKILIFSQFTSMLALIEKELNKRQVPYVMLTGKTTDRDTPVQRFQNGEVPVFLISLKAGGAGLNLTAADTVIHYDPWWNPAVEDQATDRAYRIGQDKPVFVYKLIASGTLEEKMLTLKERKKALAQGIYSGGGQKAAGLTAKDLDVLFEPLAAS